MFPPPGACEISVWYEYRFHVLSGSVVVCFYVSDESRVTCIPIPVQAGGRLFPAQRTLGSAFLRQC